jgi:hypothetical protein
MPTLVVQQGHCYRKTGATGTTGEQAFATTVAQACVLHLHGRGGWKVRTILADDPSSLYAGDAFAAVHCDGSIHPSARGASVGFQDEDGRILGQAWKRAYQARGWSGGWRADNYTDSLANYYGVRTARNVGNPRAFIIEAGFLTNSDDRALLTGPGGADRVAYALGDALGIPLEENMVDTPTVMDIAYRVRDLLYGEEVQTGGPNKGQPLPMVRHFLAQAYRTEALVHMRPEVLGGPTGKTAADPGERVELVEAIAELDAKLIRVLSLLQAPAPGPGA